MQRRAIEDLILDWPIGKLWYSKDKIEFYLSDEPDILGSVPRIYCLGISEGYGTCSGIHGMNVAVFGRNKPKQEFRNKDNLKNCTYAVLLSDSWEEDGQIKSKVELLHFQDLTNRDKLIHVYLKKTGKSATYIELV